VNESALTILERTFRPIDVPISIPRVAPRAGVYLLIDLGSIVYVGSSGHIEHRLHSHAVTQRTRSESKSFDRALWIPLPVVVHRDYEGAFIRALCPRDCLKAPRHRGNDAEILDGFGLSHLSTDGWADHVERMTVRRDSVSRPVSARTRERAAMICAIAASNPGIWSYADTAHELGIGGLGPAVYLAWDAWATTRKAYRANWRSPMRDAEAESLLRSGWSPGDDL
jgi:hypothetical protein